MCRVVFCFGNYLLFSVYIRESKVEEIYLTFGVEVGDVCEKVELVRLVSV